MTECNQSARTGRASQRKEPKHIKDIETSEEYMIVARQVPIIYLCKPFTFTKSCPLDFYWIAHLQRRLLMK